MEILPQVALKVNESLDLLYHKDWSKGRIAHLTAIDPMGKEPLDGRSFTPDQQGECAAWIADMSREERNIYFSVNNPDRPHSKPKLNKGDIAYMAGIHIDLDPPKDFDNPQDNAKDLKEWMSETLPRLQNYNPAPTVIVASGGGLNGYWFFKEAVPVPADDPESLEAYNVKTQVDFGDSADNCQNVDRIMRLPGTINLPTPIKLKAGRGRSMAYVVEAHWGRLYSLDDFTPGEKPEKTVPGPPVALPDDLPEVDISALPISEYWKLIAVHGHDPGRKGRKPSNSEWSFGFTCQMVRAGVPDDVIASCLLDPDLGISKHCCSKPNRRAYVAKEIRRAKEKVNGERN